MIGRSGGGNAVRAAAYGSAGVFASRNVAPANAVRMAAYRSGDRLKDDQGRVFNFSYKHGEIWHSEVMAPGTAPSWAADRLGLWQAVEGAERRKDAQLFRECLLTLPRELGREQCVALVRRFVSEQFVRRGMAADINIHCPPAADGEPQPHAHVMLTLRRLGPDGFGQKAREWNDRGLVPEWRAAWARAENDALNAAGSPERVDHRSLAAQREEATLRAEKAREAGLAHLAERHERQARVLSRVPQKPRGVSPAVEVAGRMLERKRRYQWAAVRRKAEDMARGAASGGQLHGMLWRTYEYLRGRATPEHMPTPQVRERAIPPLGWEPEHGR